MQYAAKRLGMSIVGMGHAGQARKRCIEAHPRTYLVATVSRREPGSATFEDVCRDAAVDAVVVCTENALHPMQVEQALRFGKHVLVEFPLAFEAHQCRSLFELARHQDLVLQVEFVGLLSQYHAEVAAFITREPIAAARLDFSGRWYRWVAAEAQAARWGQLGVARLLTLRRWFGPLDLKAVHLTEHNHGYQLEAYLVSQNGVQIVFCDQRGVHLRRAQHLELTLAGGQRISPERQRESHDLFARDLDRFIQQIDYPGQVEPYVCREAIIQTTALAAAISRRAAALQ